MVVGFLYSQLLRIQVLLGVMIWGSIAASIGILFACGGYAYYIAGEWAAAEEQVHSDWNIRAAKICSYILFGLGGLAVVITIFLRKQIQLSMACVKAAARSMSAMPTMVLFPFMQVIGVAAFMIVLIVYGVHLASLGDITVEPTGVTGVAVRKYEFDELTKQMGWYLLFCAFWTVSFVVAMGEIVIAMCVSRWYFSRDKSKVGMCTVFSAIGETFRYHIGTAAFGSFIIAVTKMVRAFVTYLQKKAKDMNNKVGEALLCCCQCCLWLFEKVVKFLNKNAYIQTAIFGTAFCRSAREAFTLIMRNAGKVASITYVSTLILFVGKIFISALTTGAAYVYIDRELGEEIYSTAGPCFVIFVSSFFIGEMFLSIFDMSTSTILQCFVADEEMFDGDECYAEGDLRKWIDDFEEEERRIIAGQT
jgi:choline transporter-like protein 2/4/5